MNPGKLFELMLHRNKVVNQKHVRCSFCGRSKDDVDALVSGPGVYICDRCVRIADRIITESRVET